MKKNKLHLRNIRSMQSRADTLKLSASARKRLRWFNYYLSHECNISLTCRYYGIARSTFIRWAERFDPKNAEALEDQSRSPHVTREKETPAHIVDAIRTLRTENPYASREDLCSILQKQHACKISVATVGRIIQDNGLFFGTTTSHKQKRKSWLATHSADNELHTSNAKSRKSSLRDASLHLSPA